MLGRGGKEKVGKDMGGWGWGSEKEKYRDNSRGERGILARGIEREAITR